VVRVWGCFAPLWFDEIFGMVHAVKMHGFGDLFFTEHDDNKHHLIALWFWVLGMDRGYFVYRIPSLIAGLTMPPAIYLAVEPRHGARVAFLAAFFSLTSYQVIDLSCEARGYSLAMAMAAGAWLFCGRYLQNGKISAATGFWVCSVLGFLSHLTFLYAAVGFVCWSAWELRGQTWPVWRYRMVVLHAPVGLAMLWLYGVDLRYLRYVGGPHLSLYELFAVYVRDTFNIPAGWENSLGVAALVLVIVGIFLMIRRRRSDWPLYVGAILCVAWAIQHRIQANFAERYIVAVAPLLMVPLAVVFDEVGRVGGLRAAAAIVALLFGIGGVWHGWSVFCGHRPGYVEAASFMAENSKIGGDSVDCGWDNYVDDLTLAFYCRRRGCQSVWPNVAPAQWWILPIRSDESAIRRGPGVYRFVGNYPNRGAGWGWSLYEIDAGR
jgi:hypothetical protein